jgi:hypothetical protein
MTTKTPFTQEQKAAAADDAVLMNSPTAKRL